MMPNVCNHITHHSRSTRLEKLCVHKYNRQREHVCYSERQDNPYSLKQGATTSTTFSSTYHKTKHTPRHWCSNTNDTHKPPTPPNSPPLVWLFHPALPDSFTFTNNTFLAEVITITVTTELCRIDRDTRACRAKRFACFILDFEEKEASDNDMHNEFCRRLTWSFILVQAISKRVKVGIKETHNMHIFAFPRLVSLARFLLSRLLTHKHWVFVCQSVKLFIKCRPSSFAIQTKTCGSHL